MQPRHGGLVGCLFSCLADSSFYFAPCLFDYLLDAGGMDAHIQYELGQSYASHLTPNRVKGGKGYRFRGVIYDEVNASSVFQRPYVTAFSANNAPFHIIAGY